MTIKESIQGGINRIAETHFIVKPVLVNALHSQLFTQEGQSRTNGAKTYYEFWTNSFGESFHDMGTLIRLGTQLELGLKYYYMNKKGHLNLVALQSDPHYEMNIFQRLMPWTNKNVLNLYIDQIGYDLSSNLKLKDMQELMLYRHLYAHNAGLLNDKFVNDFYRLTGRSFLALPSLDTYPNEDTYFFKPLTQLNQFIEDARRFFSQFP